MHGHGHGHGHGHHDHGDLRPRALLAMGASAGLIPCPSALVVLLGAVAQHQIGLGMVLIVAFSAGLAATLTGLGLLVVAAGRVSTRLSGARAGRVLAVLPALSAIAIVAVGARPDRPGGAQGALNYRPTATSLQLRGRRATVAAGVHLDRFAPHSGSRGGDARWPPRPPCASAGCGSPPRAASCSRRSSPPTGR